MPLAEELERLSGEKPVLKKLNGWHVPHPPASRRGRLIDKNGRILYRNIEIPDRLRYTCRFIKNWFHLLIECSWRAILVVFLGGFLLSWTIFGAVYYFITLYYSYNTPGKICVMNVHCFVTAFLFSMESQHTIGYGHRYMTDNCPIAYMTLSFQVVLGHLLQTMLAGIVVAKVLRPKKRRQEMRFSRVAVVGPVDDTDPRPTLMIRLADVQEKLFLAESHVRLYMASSRINSQGDRELVGVKDINVGYDSGWDRVLLLWPITIRHVIDENSPLKGVTKENILNQEFELIMTVEGIVEATGMTFQARTSFMPNEILWGQRFKPMVLLNDRIGKFEVHYSMFDETERVDFPPPTARSEEEEEHEHHNASGFL